MLVIWLAAFAALVQKGESDCFSYLEDCQKIVQDAASGPITFWNAARRKKEVCCAVTRFENCFVNARKECHKLSQEFLTSTMEKTMSGVDAKCSSIVDPCNSGSVDSVNSVAVYLLLYLGYYLYVNKF